MSHKKGFYEAYVKRPLDCILSAATIVALSPVMGTTALLVRRNLGAPVLFTQNRPGKDEKIFKLKKFRSMSDERDENGELLPDEVRLTAFGKKLRSTSLDELPELLNILKGDMSIVGPRPLLPQYLPYYTEKERQRHEVRPGLTGLAQVSGRNDLSWEERLCLDTEYVNSISFRKDAEIVFKTILTVFRKEGIGERSADGSDDFDVYRRNQMKMGDSNEY